MADEDEFYKGELVEGHGAFLLRERDSYRVKEEDWRQLGAPVGGLGPGVLIVPRDAEIHPCLNYPAGRQF